MHRIDLFDIVTLYSSMMLLIFHICISLILISKINFLIRIISAENRHISPGKIWYLTIPLFSAFWSFYVLNRVSESIISYNNYLGLKAYNNKYRLGLYLCIMILLSYVPYIFLFLAIPCFIVMIQLIKSINKQASQFLNTKYWKLSSEKI